MTSPVCAYRCIHVILRSICQNDEGSASKRVAASSSSSTLHLLQLVQQERYLHMRRLMWPQQMQMHSGLLEKHHKETIGV
jgi:hypothetical protein